MANSGHRKRSVIRWDPLKVPAVCCVAGRSTITQRVCVRRTAATIAPPTVTAILVFVRRGLTPERLYCFTPTRRRRVVIRLHNPAAASLRTPVSHCMSHPSVQPCVATRVTRHTADFLEIRSTARYPGTRCCCGCHFIEPRTQAQCIPRLGRSPCPHRFPSSVPTVCRR